MGSCRSRKGIPTEPRELFDKYLDLRPLGRRQKGLVHCIFHPHQHATPSLSVDLTRGLFHCFTCDAKGGVRKFAERVGAVIPRTTGQIRQVYGGPSLQARMDVLELGRLQPGGNHDAHNLGLAADFIRRARILIGCARAVARVWIRTDQARTWEILGLAARLEVVVEQSETELDDVLKGPRLF